MFARFGLWEILVVLAVIIVFLAVVTLVTLTYIRASKKKKTNVEE